MSMFARLWNFIRRPTGYVGKDLQGNFFYEYPSRTGDRSRRVVKYRGQTDTLAVVQRSRALAVQWKAWLTHTRVYPPTLEELQADVLRQERLRRNVALIEARDREERLRLAAGQNADQPVLSSPQHDPKDASANSTANEQRSSVSKTRIHDQQQRKERHYEHDPWLPPPASDEPQSWTPRAIQRGA
ncbi:hypothetical protein ACEPAF_1387 [Sanghuangporus sanghuang]